MLILYCGWLWMNPNKVNSSLTTDGAVYLFVVNHPQGNSQVEIFRFVEDENALQYIKTIKHELLHKYVLL